MAIYRIVACGHSDHTNAQRPSCRWVLDCNGVGHRQMKKCPRCGNWTICAQASDPALLLEWCAEYKFTPPQWLVESVPVG